MADKQPPADDGRKQPPADDGKHASERSSSHPTGGKRLRSADLISTMRQTIDRMVFDKTARGDLKILSRTLIELRYAFSVFRPYRQHRKVTVFGSARTDPSDDAYHAAEAFGRRMAQSDWMVVTGAGGGIMEAGHRGAGREHSMGLNIMLPFEQSANPVVQGDPKLVTMKYFFTRKLMFVKECHAVVSLPGGFGTLDETAEVLTLLQTGKHSMIPVVLLDAPGGTYWKEFGAFVRSQLLAGKMISPNDLSLYKITESVDEAADEVLGFYRVYHSMRYVQGQLVLRIQERLSDAKMERIQNDFADILVKGKFRQTNALPEEHSEAELSALPRLVFHFNRRSLGRLRMLIDFINRPE